MKEIITKDGTVTFYNEEYDDIYHSKSGAYEESLHKFVLPCKELFNKKKLNVLDVCFGLGYNSSVLIDEVRKINKDCRIKIIGLENDKKILSKINELNFPTASYGIIKEVSRKESYDKDNVNIKLIVDDARISIKTLKQESEKFDIVFLDPFSPKKCPELWTKEFFEDITILMKKGSILTTYSCARNVRENLISAGLNVKDGPCIGRRAPSTICFL